jgi:hypothetical protein
MSKSLVNQIKAELCERYGLNADQISVDLTIQDLTKEEAVTIMNDYDKYKTKSPEQVMNKTCGVVFGKEFNTVACHMKKEVLQNA